MTYASDEMQRTWTLVEARSRKKCHCCGRRATHYGWGGPAVLTMGCEWYVRKWCKEQER